MRYEVLIEDIERMSPSRAVDLAKEIGKKVPGVKESCLGSFIENPEKLKEFGRSSFVAFYFLGRFDPNKILSEFCNGGYAIKESKLSEN